MENFLAGREQYQKMIRAGQKYYRAAQSRGEDPYPPVLDELLDWNKASDRQYLGTLDIPAERIVGTRTRGRQAVFAKDFLPLPEENSEFATKWIRLCASHLKEGIRDPIECFEYLGKFYVQEGNKRVSVLKSFDAPTVRGRVTRIVPVYSDDPAIVRYYEFMHFYSLSGLYEPEFSRPGGYAKLQAALGKEPDQVWTEEERRHFSSAFLRLRDLLQKRDMLPEGVTAGDVLRIWLQYYPFSDLKEKSAAELNRALDSLRQEIDSLAHDRPIQVSTEPPKEEKSLSSTLLGIVRPEHVTAAFIYTAPPAGSRWFSAHEKGRLAVEAALGGAVTTRAYVASPDQAQEVMETAIREGAEVIFAVTPTLEDACRKIAATHPKIRVLNCSLTSHRPGVRSYHARTYEAKFILGAIAGAMCGDGPIGYVADYPIYGVPAAVNAFALGAQCVNPRARVRLGWTCLGDGEAEKALRESGCTVISRLETGVEPESDKDWGLCRVGEEGLEPLASPIWIWGRYYERVIRSILNGSYGSDKGYSAINYWWGIGGGVIDVSLSPTLPDGVQRLALVLQRDIAEGRLEPFRCRLTDQAGVLHSNGFEGLGPEEIMRISYLLDAVDGYIPGFDELREAAKPLVRALGLYRRYLPPEKESDIQL